MELAPDVRISYEAIDFGITSNGGQLGDPDGARSRCGRPNARMVRIQ
jgi:hypothetical protein